MNERDKSQRIQEILVLVGLLILLGVLLALMFMVGRYSFRQADDYSYAYVEEIWFSTHSIWKTLLNQVQASIDTWRSWQGLYFGNWLNFVALAFWGRDHYYMTVYITTIPLVLSQLYAGRVIFHDWLKGTRVQSYIIVLPILLLQLMFPASAAEAFYWICGSVLYTTSYALEIILITLLLKQALLPGESAKGYFRAAVFFLSFAVAGCNYVSAITVLCVYGIIVIALWMGKKRERIIISMEAVWFGCWFLVNVFSPGAAIRQNASGEGMRALPAIGRSFEEAWRYMKTWWILPVTLSLLALLPVLVRVIKRGQWRYRMPMLFSMLTFCVYAAQFTPCLYALGIIGAYRVQNLYRFSLYVLLLLNEWYWAGYLLSVWDKYKLGDSKFGVLLRRILTGIKLKTCIFSFLAVLVIAPIMLFRYGNTVTAVSAFRTLRSGEALQYYQENLERRSLLESDAEDVVLEPFTAAPYLLYFSDLKEQPDAWENVACAQYYGKRSVRVLRK